LGACSALSAAPSSQTAPTTSTAPTTTTTTQPTPTTVPVGSTGPLTSPPLPTPGPGFAAGKVNAIGDSVMEDYQDALEKDIPGITVDAGVSRQWSQGEQMLQQWKASGTLGAVVIVGLGTNGPITDADFDAMMTILQGASRVVFVTVVVGQPWQNQVNQVLTAGAARYPTTVVLADWTALSAQNPGWLYSDGTHLPINGAGAQALAALVASKV
jgi:hypothetical protein